MMNKYKNDVMSIWFGLVGLILFLSSLLGGESSFWLRLLAIIFSVLSLQFARRVLHKDQSNWKAVMGRAFSYVVLIMIVIRLLISVFFR